MMKYRKKPIVIEAMQFMGDVGSLAAIEAWSRGSVRYSNDDGVVCETLEGPLHVSDDDWVIRGVKGEFYPCKPDVFEATYEPAETESVVE